MFFKLFLLATLVLATSARRPLTISVDEFSFTSTDGTPLNVHYARPERDADVRGGLLVVHDWNGRDEFENNKAVAAAELGFAVLAADIFGATGSSIQENIALTTPFNQDRFKLKQRLEDNLAQLNQKLQDIGQNVGFTTNRVYSSSAFGFCFGGQAVLDMARHGLEVKSVISFHGGLKPIPNFTDNLNVTIKILSATGFDDSSIDPQAVIDFETEMTARNADFQTIVYSKTGHSFTNPADSRYNAHSDKRSWAAMKYLLDEDYPKNHS